MNRNNEDVVHFVKENSDDDMELKVESRQMEQDLRTRSPHRTLSSSSSFNNKIKLNISNNQLSMPKANSMIDNKARERLKPKSDEILKKKKKENRNIKGQSELFKIKEEEKEEEKEEDS